MEATYIVYRHIRLDTLKPFYIGKGKNNDRALCSTKRNAYWNNIANKTAYLIDTVASNLTEEDAFELECFLISLYGRKDNKTGILVNMTDGGEGRPNVLGTTLSKETKIKIGNANRGRELSKESIKNITEGTKKAREANTVIYGTDEWKQGNKGNVTVIYSQEIRNTITELNKTGYSVNRLSTLYKLNAKTIEKLIKENGEKVISYTTVDIDLIRLEKLYKLGRTSRSIAKSLGTSKSTVLKYIKQLTH